MKGRRFGPGLRGLVLPVLFATALPVLADPTTGAGQGGTPPPPRLVFNLSSGLTYDDNPDLTKPASGAGSYLDTRLGLALNQTTRLSSFSLSLDGLLRAGGGGGGTASDGVREPAVKLGYKADTGNTQISLDLGDQRSAVDLFEPSTLPDGTLSATDLVAATGTVTHQQVGFSIKTGIEQPLSFDLSGNYDARLYSDTTSTSVYDSHVRSGAAGAHWRIDPISTLSLTAAASSTDYANTTATRQRSHDVSLGYDRELRPDLTLQVSLGQSTATANAAGVTAYRSSGVIGSLGLTQKQADGTMSVTLASSRDALGTRTQLNFGRSLVLPTGSLSVTAGVSGRDAAATQVVGNLAYARIMPVDTFNLNLSRQIGLNSSNVDQASTVLGMSWQHKVNTVSSLGLSLSLSATGGAGGGTVDGAARGTLGATWSRDLARDWKLSAGYKFRSLDQSSAANVVSNSVFLTISRKLTLLP
ncbi:MAG: hypothetical protein ACOH2H_20755 [Cypionkella sp.]